MPTSDLEFAQPDAHEFIATLRASEQQVVLKAIEALRALWLAKGFGTISITVVGGKIRQAELKQTVQG